jgi:hypothetical protein
MTSTRGTSLRLYPGTRRTIKTIRLLALKCDPNWRYTQADMIRDGLQAVSHRLEERLRGEGKSTAVYRDEPVEADEPAPFTGPPKKPAPRVD